MAKHVGSRQACSRCLGQNAPGQRKRKDGTFELTCRPYLEKLEDMPGSYLVAEGGMVSTLEEFYELTGKPASQEVTVIRFKKIEP